MKITGSYVPVVALPRALLAQKEDWDVDALLAIVAEGTTPSAPAVGVGLRDDATGRLVGCSILIVDPIFRHVYVGALIIDKAARGLKGLSRRDLALPEAFSVVQELAFELARTYHLSKVRWGTPHPRAMKRLVHDRKVRRVETLVEVNVDPADDVEEAA